VVYSGSVGGWYMTDEMAALFAALKRQRPDAFFLWLTMGPTEIVESAMRKAGVEAQDYAIRNVPSDDVSSFLSAGDIGIAFYRPGISRLGTSPVKVSEYLSCGLPVVMNAGIGDSDQLITSEGVGALVKDFSAAEYAKAAESILGFADRAEQTRQHSREVAERLFDLRGRGIERYARLYEALLN
jgi:glycosyltransferase involved in cell wall biosynthesis